ncbi:MAG: hypothetical protein M0R77_10515 [Gammaproteobacteria bacterium]|nr:hypothetical protein [Gammaproteobacteria bacterium]
MKADKIISMLLTQNQQSWKRRQLWGQVQILERAMSQWENLKKVSPRQHHIWSKKFWDMCEWFCIELTDHLEIYKAAQFKAPGRQPPNYPRFLKKLYEFDSDRAHQLMMKQPLAFSIVEEDWALWTRIVI